MPLGTGLYKSVSLTLSNVGWKKILSKSLRAENFPPALISSCFVFLEDWISGDDGLSRC